MNKESLSSAEQTAVLAEEIFKKLPLAYKRLITFPDWLMVLGGVKAVTDYGFLGNTWDEDEFALFKQVLESTGLRVSDVQIRYGKENITFRYGYIYNTAALAAQTAKTDLAPPYNGQDSIEKYIEAATAKGYDPHGLYGKLYSFPESAIKDFFNRPRREQEDDARLEFGLGNETYWVYPPVQKDVLEREELKRKFLSDLENTPQLQTILQGADLQASNQEWRNRLPDQVKVVVQENENRFQKLINQMRNRMRRKRV